MIIYREVTLLHAIVGPIKAAIVALMPELATRNLMGAWWHEITLDQSLLQLEIDRNWDWNDVEVEYEGRPLRYEKIAIVTGNEGNSAIQGAMIVTSQPISSIAESGSECLLVEFLFTAPRNRPHIRTDRKPWVMGVGTQLLIWAAWFSKEKGYEGRLRLDASPDFIEWYERRGLQKLKTDPILYREVSHTPMELSAAHARELLSAWDE